MQFLTAFGRLFFDNQESYFNNVNMHTLYIASDHAGFQLKTYLKQALGGEYDIVDCGPEQLNQHDDYPDYARIVAEKVLAENARGVLICDTGIGMSIAANRYEGIRAALVVTEFMAERSRLHNDANILCLGEILLTHEENEQLVRCWLTTDFTEQERHIRRIQKLDALG